MWYSVGPAHVALGLSLTWVRGFVNNFLTAPLPSLGSREAAIQRWNSQKTFYKTSYPSNGHSKVHFITIYTHLGGLLPSPIHLSFFANHLYSSTWHETILAKLCIVGKTAEWGREMSIASALRLPLYDTNVLQRTSMIARLGPALRKHILDIAVQIHHTPHSNCKSL